MPFRYDPPISPTAGILQTISLIEDGKAVGVGRWHSAPDETEGVAQIIEFYVPPAHQRQGHGKRLLAALIDQCQLYHRQRKTPFRRLWLPLHHKRHVLARAFFLSQGFNHTATIKEIARDEDLLVYVRTFE